MEFEVTATERVICTKCGVAFGRRKGNFYTCYAESYRGIGYLPICKQCIEEMFQAYLAQCRDMKMAVRQMCRKLDLYWSEDLFKLVEAKNTARTVMIQYLGKINNANHAKKSYDTTLMEEGLLWNFELIPPVVEQPQEQEAPAPKTQKVSNKVVSFWGPGYSAAQYKDLEGRLNYWRSRLGMSQDDEFDIGTETIIKQICALELDIAAARAEGRPVDKLITSLNTMLGSANLKPVQQKQEEGDAGINSTPLGVWIYRFENKRPLPEIDDDLKDVNGIRKYVFTWMGHLCKMLGIKNAYSQLYDRAIAEFSVDKPEYDGDDDEFWFGEDQANEDGNNAF